MVIILGESDELPEVSIGARVSQQRAVVEALGTFLGTDEVEFSLTSLATGTTRKHNHLHDVGVIRSSRPLALSLRAPRRNAVTPVYECASRAPVAAQRGLTSSPETLANSTSLERTT